MKTLRIIFTVLCAICIAALYPVGVFLDLPFVLGVIAIGGTSFLLMLWCRKRQWMAEQKKEPVKPVGDFFHPLPKQADTSAEETPATPAPDTNDKQA